MADLFTQDQTETIDPTKDYFAELVGEGKQFSDPKALARGKAESNLHIKRIEADNAALREELKNAVSLKAVMDRLNEKTPVPPTEQDIPPQEENGKGLTQEELDALLDRKLNERQAKTAKDSNLEFVNAELVRVFGSDEIARSEINRKAKELDIHPDILKQMAQQTPKAFLALVTETTRTQTISPPRSSVQSGNQKFTPTGPRKKSQWDEIRKSDRVKYHSKELTRQRHDDAMRLGEAFFDI